MTTAAPSARRFWLLALYAIGMDVIAIGMSILGVIILGKGLGDGSLASLGLGIIGAIIGYILGILISLVLLKIVIKEPGSILLGFLTAFIWGIIALVIGAALEISTNLGSTLILICFLILPGFALAGFYFRRRKESV